MENKNPHQMPQIDLEPIEKCYFLFEGGGGVGLTWPERVNWSSQYI